jgi:hypothetical protein
MLIPTHQFIVKIYIYLEGYMFQLYAAIIRLPVKNRSVSKFYLYICEGLESQLYKYNFDMDLFFSRGLMMAV